MSGPWERGLVGVEGEQGDRSESASVCGAITGTQSGRGPPALRPQVVRRRGTKNNQRSRSCACRLPGAVEDAACVVVAIADDGQRPVQHGCGGCRGGPSIAAVLVVAESSLLPTAVLMLHRHKYNLSAARTRPA